MLKEESKKFRMVFQLLVKCESSYYQDPIGVQNVLFFLQDSLCIKSVDHVSKYTCLTTNMQLEIKAVVLLLVLTRK